MTKQRGIIIAVIILLVLLGVLALSRTKKSATSLPEQAIPEQNKPQSQESITKGSLRSLLASGKNVSCEINYPDGNTKGITYVSGSKMRGDFTVKSEDGKEMISHMLNDGIYAYIWTDLVKQGTKMKLDTITPSSTPKVTPSAQTAGADLDREVDLKCKSWSVEDSKFKIPEDIQFSDLSTLMKNPSGTALPKTDKSVCDQIPDLAAKSECLKALGN